MAIVMQPITEKQYFFITDGSNIFKAYTTEGMSLTFNNEFKDAVNEILGNDVLDMMKIEGKYHTGFTAIANRVGKGYVPNFDIPRFYGYTGMGPITWTAKGYLPLEKGSADDFQKPIEALGNMALPHRGGSFSDFASSTLGVALSSGSPMIRSAAGMIEEGIPVVEGAISAIFQWDALAEADMNVYTIEVPTMIKKQIAFYWGHKEGTPGIIRIQPCVIKSVSLNAPAPSIAGSDGKVYPAYIEVTLTLEYARTPTDAILKDYMVGKFSENGKKDLAAEANALVAAAAAASAATAVTASSD